MENAKYCRDQSLKCLDLAKSARSEAEFRLLKSISESWARVANQIDRYTYLKESKAEKANDAPAPIGHASSSAFPNACLD
jgi:hypothetical protein